MKNVVNHIMLLVSISDDWQFSRLKHIIKDNIKWLRNMEKAEMLTKNYHAKDIVKDHHQV